MDLYRFERLKMTIMMFLSVYTCVPCLHIEMYFGRASFASLRMFSKTRSSHVDLQTVNMDIALGGPGLFYKYIDTALRAPSFDFLLPINNKNSTKRYLQMDL